MSASGGLPRTIVVTLAVIAATAWASIAAADGSRFDGRSLVEAISLLEAEGLEIYYSSDLVRPWMTVKATPTATAPADVLAELLRPYDLAVQEGPYESLVVVRADRATEQAQPGAILGIVKDARTGRRISGAAVTVLGARASTTTSASGHFSLVGFRPGRYTLRVSEAGLAEVALHTVEVESGRAAVTSATPKSSSM